MAFDIDPLYKEVPERIADLKVSHPNARLRPVDPEKPFEIVTIGERVFVVYAAACYLDPDDQLPGIGVAWEPFPGKTPYTKDSELMNAETSAWGRAIVAALQSESKAIASANEVRNRKADQDAEPAPTVHREAPQRPVAPSQARIALATAQDPSKISEKQLKLVAVLFGKKGFPDDRAVRHEYVKLIVGHEFASSKELSKQDASKLIDALNAEPDPGEVEGDAESEQPF